MTFWQTVSDTWLAEWFCNTWRMEWLFLTHDWRNDCFCPVTGGMFVSDTWLEGWLSDTWLEGWLFLTHDWRDDCFWHMTGGMAVSDTWLEGWLFLTHDWRNDCFWQVTGELLFLTHDWRNDCFWHMTGGVTVSNTSQDECFWHPSVLPCQDQTLKAGEMQVDEALLEGHLGITRELLAFTSAERKFNIGSENGGANLIRVSDSLPLLRLFS